ncbi:PucR family transcriptional regulator [Nocardia asteroides]|uniref:PucR family transcriptional regulator n=1 Tax=Nocardia asteroides TaxID=1824 RepID=UPI00341F12C1
MTRSNSALARASGSDGEWRATMPNAEGGEDAERANHLVAALAEDEVDAAAIEDVVAAWAHHGVSMDTVLRYAVLREHHSAIHAVTAALLDGHASATLARRCGVEIAPHYWIIALSVPEYPAPTRGNIDRSQARRRLERIRAELFRWSGGDALSLLTGDGGTVLIPGDVDADDLDALFAALGRAAEVPITGAVAHCPYDALPAWSDRTHGLLDMVQRFGAQGRLHRFADLALEFQLTRPGPGRDFLAALLDPLDDHPELLATLQCHIAHDVNRQRTARALHVHPNTVDFRLKRIARLTGCDATRSHGLWRLRSALIARSYHSTHTGAEEQ